MTRMTRPDCAVMCNLINTHTHTHTRMTRMTGPNCVVMCNLINTHTHTPWEDQCEWHRMTRIVGEEDRDSLDAGAGETAEEKGTAATTTCHRSSAAKVRSDRPVRYLGGLVNEDGELTQGINHRSRAAWA